MKRNDPAEHLQLSHMASGLIEVRGIRAAELVGIAVVAVMILALGAMVFRNDALLLVIKERQDNVRAELSATRGDIRGIPQLFKDMTASQEDRLHIHSELNLLGRDLDRVKETATRLADQLEILDDRVQLIEQLLTAASYSQFKPPPATKPFPSTPYPGGPK